MYWAANDAKVLSGQTASVGDNCATLASYASGLADSAIGNTCGQFSGRRRLRSHQDLSLPSRRRLTTYGPCEGCLVGSEGNLCKNPTNNVCYNYVNGVEGSCWGGTFPCEASGDVDPDAGGGSSDTGGGDDGNGNDVTCSAVTESPANPVTDSPANPVTDSPANPDTPVTESPDTDGSEGGDNGGDESDSTMIIVIAVIAVAVVIVVGVGMYYMGVRSGKTPSSGADVAKSRSSKYGTEIEMDTTKT